MRPVFTYLCVGVMTFAAVRGYAASPEEETAAAKQHYQAGLAAYKAGKYDEAIKELQEAYSIKKIPALLTNIAATYRKLGDNVQALAYYRQYLTEAPADARDRATVEKAISELENAPPPPPALPPAPPPAPEPAKPVVDPEAERIAKLPPFSHTVIDAAPPDSPMDVRMTVPGSNSIVCQLFYRSAGEENFHSVAMKKRTPEAHEVIARVPAEAMAGKAVQYYIEAKKGDSMVRAIGNAQSPNIVMIDPSAPPVMVGVAVPVEAEPAPAPPPPPTQTAPAEDAEVAPVMGSAAGRSNSEPKSSRNRPLLVSGAVLTALGIASVGVGIFGNVRAKQYSDTVAFDSRPANAQCPGACVYNDPNLTSDSDLAIMGKNYGIIGLACTVGGAVMATTGALLLIADAALLHKGEGRRRRVQKTRSHAQLENGYVVPALGPTLGLSGGFSF